MADELTVALAAILERNEHLRSRYGYVGGLLALTGAKDDVPHLVAAVEAALELHRPVDRGTGAQCKGCATHITFTPWPCPTYRAITAALSGKEASDEG